MNGRPPTSSVMSLRPPAENISRTRDTECATPMSCANTIRMRAPDSSARSRNSAGRTSGAKVDHTVARFLERCGSDVLVDRVQVVMHRADKHGDPVVTRSRRRDDEARDLLGDDRRLRERVLVDHA